MRSVHSDAAGCLGAFWLPLRRYHIKSPVPTGLGALVCGGYEGAAVPQAGLELDGAAYLPGAVEPVIVNHLRPCALPAKGVADQAD